MFGVSPHFASTADRGEYVASVLGAIVVLVVGSIWRKRRLRQLEELALPAAIEAAQPIERP